MLKQLRLYFAKRNGNAWNEDIHNEIDELPTQAAAPLLDADAQTHAANLNPSPFSPSFEISQSALARSGIQPLSGNKLQRVTAKKELELGHHYLEKAQFQAAIAHYRQALAINPHLVEAYQYLAEALREVGELAEAAACYRKAIELEEQGMGKVQGVERRLLTTGQPDHESNWQNGRRLLAVANHQSIASEHNQTIETQLIQSELIQPEPLNAELIASERIAEPNEHATIASAQTRQAQTRQTPDKHTQNGHTQNGHTQNRRLQPAQDHTQQQSEQNRHNNRNGHSAQLKENTRLASEPAHDAQMHLAKAEKCYEQEDWTEAIVYCRRALQNQPNSSVYKLLGNALQKLGQFDEAMEAYSTALQLQPGSAEIHANLGSLYAQQQRWQDAMIYYQSAISLKPDFAGAYRNLAKVWMQLGKPDNATEYWHRALTLEPEKVSAEEHVNFGNILLSQNRIDDAIDCYRTAIRLAPNFAGAYQNLAEAFVRRTQWQEAVRCYRKAQQLHALALPVVSQSSKGMKALNGASEERVANLALSADTQKKLLSLLQPDEPNRFGEAEERLEEAENYFEQEQWDKAIAASEEALKQLEPEMAQAYRNLADALYAKEQLQEAIEYYRRVVELEPESAADRVNLGSLYAQQEQWQEAIDCYQAALALNPDLASAHWNLAKVWEQLGQSEQASDELFYALNLEPSWASVQEHLTLCHTLATQGKTSSAVACYQQVIRLDTTCAEAHAALASVRYRQEQWHEAAAHYRQAIQHHPDHPQYLAHLGQTLAKLEQWQEAIAVYRRVIALVPEQPQPYLTLAQWLEQQGSGQEAIACYQRLATLQPENWQIHYKIGNLLNQHRRWQEAVSVFQRTIELNSEFSWAHHHLGDAFSQLQQWQDAAKTYQQAIALNPDFHGSHYNLGKAFAQLEQWDEAIGAYRRAVELQPGQPELQQTLTKALWQRAQSDAAKVISQVHHAIQQNPDNLQNYYTAIEVQPDNAALHVKLGDLLVSRNETEQAILCYQKAVQLQPDQWQAHHNLGNACLKQQRWQEAVAAYRRAIAINPEFSWSHHNLGDVLMKLEQWQEAAIEFQKAIDLNPNFHWSHQNLGDVCFKLEQWDGAIAAYQNAIKLNPNWHWSYYNLGNALAKKFQWSEAIGAYQNAIELAPDFAESHAKLADALVRQERWDEAITSYERAIELAPDSNLSVYKNLGEALLHRNRQGEATYTAVPTQTTTTARICIVTPVYNGEEFIDDTIYSIVTQAGDFVIRYHVQDGQSTDGTLEKLGQWKARLESSEFVALCSGIEFSFTSSPDQGMYDAINQGVAAINPGSTDYMTWLNADDRLAPGALATVISVFAAFEHIHWIGGRIALINEQGFITKLYDPLPYSTRALKAGLYDGRHLPFVMQEGTFWRAQLWYQVNGLKGSFRLAGDYDLWRRFAEHAEFVLVDSVLANHRRRQGQLSGNLEKYHQEIDTVLGAEGRKEYQKVLDEFNSCSKSTILKNGFGGKLLHYDSELQSWQCLEATPSLQGDCAIVLSEDTTKTAIDAIFAQGFGPAEGPHFLKGLPAGIRWTYESVSYLKFEVEQAGYYEITLICQTFSDVSIRLSQVENSHTGRTIFAGKLPITSHNRNCKVVATALLWDGENSIQLKIESGAGHSGARLLVISCEAIITRPAHFALSQADDPLRWLYTSVGHHRFPTTLPDGRPLPKISIITPSYNQGKFIEETILSVIRQGYPNVEYILVDGGSTDETMAIVNRYRDHFSCIISEPDNGQSDALNKGFSRATGEILAWLNSDDRLAPGALHAMALAFYTSNADVVAGICHVFQNDVEVAQHLASCASGDLSIDELLDVEQNWLVGKFFYQPEVMFTRKIWEKVGAAVNESLYYSMDYELWVRFAAAGARIHVIGHPIAQYRMHADQKTSAPDKYKPELMATRDALRRQFNRQLNHPTAIPTPSTIISNPKRDHLRIVMFNDVGFYGGAGIAHQRIATALSLAGHHVIPIAGRPTWYPEPLHCSTDEVYQLIASLEPDLVVFGNVHNLEQGDDIVERVAADYPTVFVMHDQWLLTGRCAYVGECTKYATACNAQCPTFSEYPSLPPAAIEAAFNKKRKLLSHRNVLVVGDSGWITDWARSAAIALLHRNNGFNPGYKFQPIYYGLDVNIFHPLDQAECRQKLGLPKDKFIILTGSQAINDERKGFRHLLKALEIANLEDVLLIGFGRGSATASHSIEIRSTGYIDDPMLLAWYYSAADVFVGPSLEEAFGQTFIEAAACGTPAIGYATGGVPEAIRDGVSGRVVMEKTPDALADIMTELYHDRQQLAQLSRTAPLYVSSQFSMQASYHHFLVALDRAGWLDKLQLTPASKFAVSLPQPVQPVYLQSDSRAAHVQQDIFSGANFKGVIISGFGGLEAPYPQKGIFRQSRWAFYPESRFAIIANSRFGRLTIRCRSYVEGQHVELWSENQTANALLSESIPNAGESHTFAVPVALQAGVNFFSLTTSRHVVDASQRSLGLLIEEITFSETSSTQEPQGVQQHIAMDDSLEGTGWFAAEHYNDEIVRWMKKIGTIIIRQVPTTRPLQVKIQGVMAMETEFLDGMVVKVNGCRVDGQVHYTSKQCWTYEAKLASGFLAPSSLCILSIESPDVKQLSSSDCRYASLLVKGVSLNPLLE